jgi:hypothetical protein
MCLLPLFQTNRELNGFFSFTGRSHDRHVPHEKSHPVISSSSRYNFTVSNARLSYKTDDFFFILLGKDYFNQAKCHLITSGPRKG